MNDVNKINVYQHPLNYFSETLNECSLPNYTILVYA